MKGDREKTSRLVGFNLDGVQIAGAKGPDTVISFFDEDYPLESVEPNEGAFVIIAQVGPANMRRIMIDNRSLVDILYTHAYQRQDREDGRWRSNMKLLSMGSTTIQSLWSG